MYFFSMRDEQALWHGAVLLEREGSVHSSFKALFLQIGLCGFSLFGYTSLHASFFHSEDIYIDAVH